MPLPYSPATILLDSTDPADVDRLNDELQDHDLGRPLGQATRTAGGHLVLPVTDADPAVLVRALRGAGATHRVRLDPLYHAGTYRLDGDAAGRPFAWQPLSDTGQAAPPWTPPPAGLRRPVVALLDTGVRPHPWLPVAPADDPFLIFADGPGVPTPWRPPAGTLSAAPAPSPSAPLGGHGTFLTGLIRTAAPSARILVVRVLADDGTAAESTVVGALQWLTDYRGTGRPLDVVCMAFGRRSLDDGDQPLLREVERLLGVLADDGVELVAAAGNDHQARPVYPAAFDRVTGIGAGFGEYHAGFSNFGPWVDRYRDGVDVVGIMPPDGWARWSGTSFAAATFAGDVARPQVA